MRELSLSILLRALLAGLNFRCVSTDTGIGLIDICACVSVLELGSAIADRPIARTASRSPDRPCHQALRCLRSRLSRVVYLSLTVPTASVWVFVLVFLLVSALEWVCWICASS